MDLGLAPARRHDQRDVPQLVTCDRLERGQWMRGVHEHHVALAQ